MLILFLLSTLFDKDHTKLYIYEHIYIYITLDFSDKDKVKAFVCHVDI